MANLALTPIDRRDQRIRRRRARLTQADVAACFSTPISDSAVGDYERGERELPFEFTSDDYEDALAAAITKKRAAQ